VTEKLLTDILATLERIAVALENTQRTPAERQRSGAGRARAATAQRDKRGHFMAKIQTLQQILEVPGAGQAMMDSLQVATSSESSVKPAHSRSQVKRLGAQGQLGPQVGILVATYIKAWQRRYNTKGRPSVGGKECGMLMRLLGQRSTQELSQLLEVYCQMKNDWFVKRRHDLGTFEQNLNDVVLALTGGKEHTGIDYDYVFGRNKNMDGGEHERDGIREPDRAIGGEVRPEALLPGDAETPVSELLPVQR
jgi:hypothetical protein